MSKGFIKVHRAIFDHEIADNEFCRTAAFLWMIQEAAWQNGTTKVGEFLTTQRQLAEHFGWTRKKVECFLEWLTSREMIVISRGPTKGPGRGPSPSLITICNYSKYQTPELVEGHEGGQQRGLFKEDKKKEKKEMSNKKGSRLKQSWRPASVTLNKMAILRPDLDMEEVIPGFIDYWIGIPGQRGCKLDWDATFRNWCRNQRHGKAVNKRGGQVNGPSIADVRAKWACALSSEPDRPSAAGDDGESAGLSSSGGDRPAHSGPQLELDAIDITGDR